MILESPDMDTETYIVMKGNRLLGYIQAYNTYHALRLADKTYGGNLIVERVSSKPRLTNGVEA
jgi:hypothetical protein